MPRPGPSAPIRRPSSPAAWSSVRARSRSIRDRRSRAGRRGPADPAGAQKPAGGDSRRELSSDLGRAVKTTVFLKSMNDFGAMNEVYGKPEYFGARRSARSTVEVARLPRDVLVEIEVVALA